VKKTIVLDLDETIIHCTETCGLNYDFQLSLELPNEATSMVGQLFHLLISQVKINVRPFLFDFLKEMGQLAEIILFTASHRFYSEKVLEYLDPEGAFIAYSLCNENCLITSEGIHLKDLRVIGNRELSDLVFVDNSSYSFVNQLENGVPIIPFYDNKSDTELLHLAEYLKMVIKGRDVRQLNGNYFRWNLVFDSSSLNDCLGRYYSLELEEPRASHQLQQTRQGETEYEEESKS